MTTQHPDLDGFLARIPAEQRAALPTLHQIRQRSRAKAEQYGNECRDYLAHGPGFEANAELAARAAAYHARNAYPHLRDLPAFGPAIRHAATPAALAILSPDGDGEAINAILDRHYSGDDGDLDAYDHAANLAAYVTGERILSAYVIDGCRVWIITEAADDDERRPLTTMLTPADY